MKTLNNFKINSFLVLMFSAIILFLVLSISGFFSSGITNAQEEVAIPVENIAVETLEGEFLPEESMVVETIIETPEVEAPVDQTELKTLEESEKNILTEIAESLLAKKPKLDKKIDICHNGNIINIAEQAWETAGHSYHPGDFIIDQNHPTEDCIPLVNDECKPLDRDCSDKETSSITICKIVIDHEGLIVDGSNFDGDMFTIPGNVIGSQGPPVATLPNTQFILPLTFSADIIGNDGIDDAECITYDNLKKGQYYYGEENISSDMWEAPLYNDQYSVDVEDLDDFYSYSDELFTPSSSDDDNRNMNSDGHIVLGEEDMRTLVVLNQSKEIKKDLGTIRICKVVLDKEGEVIDGAISQSTQFTVPGNVIGSQGLPAGTLPDTKFNLPLNLNTNLLGDDSINDAECISYNDLDPGNYYYGEEVIYSLSEWETPLYNDLNVVDFYKYSGEIFTLDPSDDVLRNTYSDGHLVLSENGNRTLVIVNKISEIGEPYLRSAEILSPYEGEELQGIASFEALLFDKDRDDDVQWAVRKGTCTPGDGTIFGNVDGYNDSYNWDNVSFDTSTDVSTWESGDYCFIFNPTESLGDLAIREVRNFRVNNNLPALDITTTNSKKTASKIRQTSLIQPQVLGAETEASLCPVFTEYMKLGDRDGKGDITQVKKLQSFLNENLGINLYIDGFFGNKTSQAVHQFQQKYYNEIISPWDSFEKTTGWFYKTSKVKANDILGCYDEAFLNKTLGFFTL